MEAERTYSEAFTLKLNSAELSSAFLQSQYPVNLRIIRSCGRRDLCSKIRLSISGETLYRRQSVGNVGVQLIAKPDSHR